MIVFQDSSTGTVAGIGDRRIVEDLVRFLTARLNGEARFPNGIFPGQRAGLLAGSG